MADDFSACVAAGLSEEMKHREAQGYLTPTSSDLPSLEKYLERAGLLKKHFQEFLFLRSETDFVESKVRTWGGIVGAMAASMFAFGFNKGLWSPRVFEASLGIGAMALMGAVIYAVQDRIKEAGKNFVTSRVGKHYAQRVTTLHAPRRLSDKEERRLGFVRESLSATPGSRPDPLNPEMAVRPVMTLKYEAKGWLRAPTGSDRTNLHAIKQVFRYDLSWVFARLDDSTKPVPVLDPSGSIVLGNAPRCYRLPTQVTLKTVDGEFGKVQVAVIHKDGLERCEPAPVLR